MSASKRSAQDVKSASLRNESNAPASKKLKSQHTQNGDHFGRLIDGAALNKTLRATLTNGVVPSTASKVDESRARVATNGTANTSEAIDISSGDESEEDEDDDDEEDEDEVRLNGQVLPNSHTHESLANGKSNEDVEMAENEDEELEEPSFGERLREHPGLIDAQAPFTDTHAESRHLAMAESITPGHSFVVPLRQALKTNDREMLESFFQRKDEQAVKNTIQRMPSQEIDVLMTKISERIHKRPGRAGPLMLWIQWSLVAHGGYLATRPELLTKLKALNQVVRQRSQGLQPLLQLKGKLELLSQQLELRKNARSQSRQHAAADDDQDLIYVEGEPETGWEEEDDDMAQIEAPRTRADAEDMDDDSLDEADPEDNEGLIDIEAEEEDEDDEIEEDEEDPSDSDEEEDDSEEESESEPEVTAPTPRTLNRKR